MFDLFREISQTISHNKLRMALTGFAVAWGIFMLIILLSLANGIINAFSYNMLTADSNSMTVWGGYTAKPWRGYKEGRPIQLKDRDMSTIEEENSAQVKSVIASLSNDTVTFTNKSDAVTGFTGVYPGHLRQSGIQMIAGRFINEIDMSQNRKVLVLDRRNAETLFGSAEAAIDKRLSGLGLSWQVIGVYDHRWRDGVFVPYSTASAINGNTGEVGSFFVETTGLTTEEDGTSVENNVRATLARIHEFDPTDDSGVWIWNRFNDRLSAQSVMKILVGAMWVIGIFTLLSGIVGVSNIMFVSVRERTHEIGIRRAIGAKRRHILTQVVLESVAVTTMFGYIGIVSGTLVMGFISKMVGNLEMMRDPSVDLSTAAVVTVILIIAGGLAGLFPAIKATKVKPVEALRDE